MKIRALGEAPLPTGAEFERFADDHCAIRRSEKILGPVRAAHAHQRLQIVAGHGHRVAGGDEIGLNLGALRFGDALVQDR